MTGKRVLDLGCGSGIAGIAAALAGAEEVWVADLDDNALMAAEVNAALNGVEVHAVDGDQFPEVDILLAADVLYDISGSAGLMELTAAIPEWLLAESNQVVPDGLDLRCLDSMETSTLPRIGDFDEAVEIGIYCRSHEFRLN
ncbi:MAG: 50S ribosomal protein L11 methyltransferase [Thalassolituus sp.]